MDKRQAYDALGAVVTKVDDGSDALYEFAKLFVDDHCEHFPPYIRHIICAIQRHTAGLRTQYLRECLDFSYVDDPRWPFFIMLKNCSYGFESFYFGDGSAQFSSPDAWRSALRRCMDNTDAYFTWSGSSWFQCDNPTHVLNTGAAYAKQVWGDGYERRNNDDDD